MAFDRKTLLATTMVAGMAMAFPTFAMAQSQTPDEERAEEQEESQATEVEAIVITGSRIRRDSFTSTQPIQVITSEEATLEGLADTTEILQSSTAANNSTQINNFFTGFVTTGGPGVNTISLRGLGAQRTLVLINGRRVGPAGVRGTVGPTDLNTIPSSQIERVEILTDGASSIYGSDAVAGVVNIITRQNLDGGNLEFFANRPFESGGEEYRISGTYGQSFDRGFITAGADFYRREELLFGDRDFFACPNDRVFLDEDLTIRGDVRVGDDYKCVGPVNSIFRAQAASAYGPFVNGQRRDGDFIFDPSAVAGGGYTGCDLDGLHMVAGGNGSCSITAQPTDIRRQAYAEYPLYSDRYESRTAISPVDRYSISLFGGFDLTPNVEVFGEFLWNRRESEQRSWRQLFPLVSPFHTDNPFGGPDNGTTTPSPTPSPGNLSYFVTPVALVNSNSDQQVDYIRAVGGLRGTAEMFDRTWDWELAAQFSRSDGTYGGNFFYNDRVEATAGNLAWFGEDLEGNFIGYRDAQFQADGNCDLAILYTADACPAGGVNWFTQDFLVDGELSPEEMAFIQGYEQGTTIYEHKYIEGVVSGELFDLPAGTVGMALGFHLREEEIDDNPGEQQRNGNLWGSTAAGRTTGSDTVKEVFAEFEIPLLADLPLVQSLDLNLSGRYSDYDSYGDNTTYKVGLNWSLTPSFRIRASQGTSFRAPALYELYLANQTSFLGQANVDPCINWGTSTNNELQQNCAAEGIPDDYTGLGSSATIITGGGIGILEPETAEATSIGLIWTPSFIDLSIALDYFEITVEDQVAQFGAGNILGACYTSLEYPNEPLCDLFERDMNPSSPSYLNILTVNDSYVNISEQRSEGLDLNIRYNREFSFGDLQLNGRFSHILDWTTRTFGDSEDEPIVGQIGEPDFVGQVSARFDRGDWTGFWSVDLVGETDNVPFFNPATNQGTFLGQPVWFERSTDFYTSHNMSVRRTFDDLTVQVGIRNVFNQTPPLVGASNGSTRIGNTPLASQYDWQGRSLTFNVTKRF